MTDPNRLVDQCVHKGLMYLAESLQYYLPASYPHENNIALHMARSFTENGFQVWAEIALKGNPQQGAEVPLKKGTLRLDFLAYSYTEKITALLEFKGHVEDPPKNVGDLNRLVDIRKNNLLPRYDIWPAEYDSQNTTPVAHRIYGIVTLLHAEEFIEWWYHPDKCKEYMPQHEKRKADGYKLIGRAINVASYRAAVPLEDLYSYSPRKLRRRFRYGAYALYDEARMDELEGELRMQIKQPPWRM